MHQHMLKNLQKYFKLQLTKIWQLWIGWEKECWRKVGDGHVLLVKKFCFSLGWIFFGSFINFVFILSTNDCTPFSSDCGITEISDAARDCARWTIGWFGDVDGINGELIECKFTALKYFSKIIIKILLLNSSRGLIKRQPIR